MALRQLPISLPLSDVLNASLNGVIILQPLMDTDNAVTDFSFAFINDRAHNQPGLLKGWRPGMTLLNWYALRGRSGLFEQYVQVFQSGEPLYVIEFQPEEGNWYELAVARVDGQIILTFHDVTQAQRAFQQMQQQRDLLQSILDISPAGIVLYEAIRNVAGQIVDFRYVLTNPANAKATDRSVTEMTGQPLSVISPTAYQSDFFRSLVQVTESGVRQQMTFPFEGDGIRGWFEASMVRQGDGVLFTFQDITALKESEQQQQKQAQLLQTVMDVSQTAISLHKAIRRDQPDSSLPSPIVLFKTLLVNNQAIHNWEVIVDNTHTQPLVELKADSPEATNLFNRFAQVVETGQSVSWNAHSPQNKRWFKLLAAKADDGVVVSSIDITESHLYQQQLEAANTGLNLLNEKLQRFASVASHDLQEPLRKMMFYSDMLIQEYTQALDKNGLNLLNTVRVAAQRMQRLINNLLFYAQLETRQTDFELVSLDELINQVLEDLSLNIQDATLTVDPLPTVMGDRVSLGQLFQNLINNALKYRREQVPFQIRITAHRVSADVLPQPVPQPRVPPPIYYWRIEVIDNGIGFRPEQAEVIFDTFERLSGQSAGTGLGLAICKLVAENHGGLLRATGQPNQGATFTLYLPA